MSDERNSLSRERITEVAADLVAREGLDALSMRRLAQELDVWPMSVYRHFRDKADLLDAVAAAGAGRVDLPARGGSLLEQLGALAAEARAALARQPPELRRRTLLSPGVFRLTDAALEALADAGVPRETAATTWSAVLAYVIGSIELDAASGTERELQAALLALPEADYPRLSEACADVARAFAGEEAFREGLDRVLRGLRRTR